MKLVLNKNFIKEVDKLDYEEKKGVVYEWYDKQWNNIELYHVEAWKVAPIVRYLITWKKRKINWFILIIAIIFSLLILSGLWYFLFSNNEEKQVQPVVIQQEEQVIKPMEIQTEITKQPEIELQQALDQLRMAEDEIVRLNKLVDDQKPEVIYKEKECETPKKIELEDFKLFLGTLLYKKCEDYKIKPICERLYYNFVNNEEN